MSLSPSVLSRRLRLPRARLRSLAVICLAAASLPFAFGEEGVTVARAPEIVDPLVGADGFAGQTVRDREMGMNLIQARGKNVPRVGQVAPDFALRTADGKQTIRLSSFKGQKPVVLIFGSHT